MKPCRWILILSLCGFFGSSAWAKLDVEEQSKVNTLAETLKLDSQQKTEVAAEREKSKRELVALEKKWQSLHDALRQEVRKNSPDEKAIDRISIDLGKVRGEIIALRTHSLVHLKSILTPSQRNILESGQPEQVPAESKP